ncbi:BTAD domain-containing putative transcriptional regulator [Demequina sp. NBRC 110051]|uniref:BTAD domain-containing putative transcriptional regulator n=1 Tax=Demequina sp. NBRC 110051 TaxID=1570340 RepID=UPI0009FDAA16|nr:BTAD domain-containing putative transcriptional regulator [Demequina sp. NBRC 110051]
MALLASRRDTVVPLHAIHEALWPEREPASAAKVIQTYVSQLRHVLGDAMGEDGRWGLLATHGAGYRLALGADAVDVAAFEAAAHAVGVIDSAEQIASARAALALWRGEPYPGIDRDFAMREAERLTRLRDDLELRLWMGIGRGGGWGEVVVQLCERVHRDPTDERVALAAIEALWSLGRRAEALRLHAQVREALADELGVDPGTELGELFARILREEPPPSSSAVTATPTQTERSPQHDEVPVARTRLIGREAELQELGALVDAERLVVVTGAGGAGKTRLALALAQARRDNRPVRWVALQGFHDDDGLVSLCLRATGGADPFDRDPLAALTARLRGDRVLLVLDNCEHLVGPVAALCHHLLAACPDLTVLATSRVPLRVAGERRWRIPALTIPEASTVDAVRASASGTLFAERAALVSPSFRLDSHVAPSVARICRRLDGIPLALELAAARTGAMGVADIDAGLAARFDLLTSGDYTDDPRHRTLRAATEWSHALLSADERVVLERLAVFAGPFRMVDASAVCGDSRVPVATVPATVADLVDKSVVERVSDDRYRLLETVREFGREQWGSERSELEHRHTRWIAEFVEEIGHELVGDTPRWYRLLDSVMLDARAAFERARLNADAVTVMRLSAGASWALINTGRFQLQVTWSRIATDMDSTDVPPHVRGAAFRMAGAIAGLDGRADEGFALLERARELCVSVDDLEGMLWCDYWSMTTLADVGNFEEAASRAVNGLAHSASLPSLEAHLEVGRGEVLLAWHVDGARPLAEVADAIAHSQRTAAALAETHGLEETGARAEMTLALVRALTGEPHEALVSCVAAVERWRTIGRGARLALALVVTSRVALLAQDLDAACRYAWEGAAACGAIGWSGALGSAAEVVAVLDDARDPESTSMLLAAARATPPTHRWRVPCDTARIAACAAEHMGREAWAAAEAAGVSLTFDGIVALVTSVAARSDGTGEGARAAAQWR